MTTDIKANKGIVVAGHGSLNATTLSVGDHARATTTLHTKRGIDRVSLALLRHEVNQLIAMLERHDEKQVHPTVQASSESLRSELRNTEPEKSTVLSLLAKLAEGTKSVTTLAQSVAALAALAATVFP